jgi:hypothetical protein
MLQGNLGNAKTLGMIGASGIGADPTGSRYALLNALYFIGYVNWSQSRVIGREIVLNPC